MTWIDWYDSLTKPTWTPAPATIRLIWQLLYPVIVVSFGFVFVTGATCGANCPGGSPCRSP